MKKLTANLMMLTVISFLFGCQQDNEINSLKGYPTDGSYPTDGLVAYFPFNGDWEDVVTPNTNVTVSKSPPKFDVNKEGKAESSIYFEGNSQYLNIHLATSIITSPNNEATIATWLRNDITADWYRTMLAESSLSTIGIQTDSELPAKVSINYNYSVEDNNEDVIGIGNTQFEPSEVGVWVHLAMTMNSKYLRLYINGKLIEITELGVLGDNQYIPILKPYIQFVLGANFTKDAFWRGNVDELFFYNKTLSDQEIEKLFQR